jgi:hypothetical protein
METKRSIGVTFWAWVFILFNILNLGTALMGIAQKFQEPGSGQYLLRSVICIIYIIIGADLLRLREWARKAVIYLAFITTVTQSLSWKLAFQTVHDSHQIFLDFTQSRPLAYPPAQGVPLLVEAITLLTYFSMVLSIVGPIIPAIYFMNSKVKEQFNQKGS